MSQTARFHSFVWFSYTEQCAGMCVYTGPHILFIHSSINGHLGYVHILAIVNKAAISIRGHYLLKLVFLFSLDKQPEREPLVHMVVLFLIF